MANFSKVSPLNENKVLSVGMNIAPLTTNCGAKVVHSVFMCSGPTANVPKNAWGVPESGENYNLYTVEEAFSVLDALKTDILTSIYTKGFVILSDRINRMRKKSSMDGAFYTVDFVNWLISRKIGTIVRAPVCMNTNHPGASAICAWIWFPENSLMLNQTVDIFNPVEFPTKTTKDYPSLQKQADTCVKEQLSYSTTEEEKDGRPTKKTSEKAGTTAAARRSKIGTPVPGM